MAINARLDETTETITLSHPTQSDLTVQPDSDPAALLNWVRPLADSNRAMPLCNHASHSAVETLTDAPLQNERWRGNIWFEGVPAWTEFDWIGREAMLGTVRLKIEERITRCLATTVNTDTGVRDIDTLGALKTMGHQDFGVYARIIETGQVAVGDQLEII